MATRKEKRAAALAKREKFFAAYRADGLKALRRDRERRAVRKQRAEDDARRAAEAK